MVGPYRRASPARSRPASPPSARFRLSHDRSVGDCCHASAPARPASARPCLGHDTSVVGECRRARARPEALEEWLVSSDCSAAERSQRRALLAKLQILQADGALSGPLGDAGAASDLLARSDFWRLLRALRIDGDWAHLSVGFMSSPAVTSTPTRARKELEAAGAQAAATLFEALDCGEPAGFILRRDLDAQIGAVNERLWRREQAKAREAAEEALRERAEAEARAVEEERQRRAAEMASRSLRRMRNRSLWRGLSAWHEMVAQKALRQRLLRRAAARLRAPRLVPALQFWWSDCKATQRHYAWAHERAMAMLANELPKALPTAPMSAQVALERERSRRLKALIRQFMLGSPTSERLKR